MSNVLLGVTGSIAAYKTPDLVAEIRRNGFNVKTILTQASQEFVTPSSIETMSRNKVYTNKTKFIDGWHPAHIELADWADIAVIAPASAATIGKLATGMAQGLLAETFLALPNTTPKILAPAMNGHMLEQPSVQRNIEQLKLDGYQIVEPRTGELACGYQGLGKLAAHQSIIQAIKESTL